MKNYQGILLIGTALLFGVPTLHAQTCNDSATKTAPDSRYTDNGNGTVTDNQTGLMWKQCSEGLSNSDNAVPACDTGSAITYTWQGALSHAQTVNSASFAGHSDWRLPNVKELSSLVEMACYWPAINVNRFPNTLSSGYWSSSPVADRSASAWNVHFSVGSGGGNLKAGGHYYVRLVRGGQ